MACLPISPPGQTDLQRPDTDQLSAMSYQKISIERVVQVPRRSIRLNARSFNW
jgi:hypothetical protein